MNSINGQVAELASLLQIYLAQENRLKDWIPAESNHHAFFRELVQAKKTAKPTIVNKPEPPLPNTVVEPLKKSTPPEKKPFQPELQAPIASADLKDIRELVAAKFPNLVLLDTVPQEAEAKNQIGFKVPAILILHYREPPIHMALLTNICRTISIYWAAAGLFDAEPFEREGCWDKIIRAPDLKTLILCGKSNQLPRLQKLVDRVPVLPLPDLSLYLKEPLQKQTLWNMLQKNLSNTLRSS